MSDLAWLVANCVSVHLSINVHRDYHLTAAEAIAEDKAGADSFQMSPEDESECIKRDSIVELCVYPDTPVGNYSITHWDLDTTLRDMRRLVESERAGRKP